MSTPNGDSTHVSVPPDIVWDEDNPPVIYECSNDIEHEDACDGNCNSYTTTEALVKLINEVRAWSRAAMSVLGVPQAYSGRIPIPGVPIELLDLKLTLDTMRVVLIEKGLFTQEELDEKFREVKYDKLHATRLANEDEIKRARKELAVAKRDVRIIGPDGRPL